MGGQLIPSPGSHDLGMNFEEFVWSPIGFVAVLLPFRVRVLIWGPRRNGGSRGEQVQDGEEDRQRVVWGDLFRSVLLIRNLASNGNVCSLFDCVDRLLLLILIAGTNVQTNEEVAIKLVSIAISLRVLILNFDSFSCFVSLALAWTWGFFSVNSFSFGQNSSMNALNWERRGLVLGFL